MGKVTWEEFDGKAGRADDRLELRFTARGELSLSRKLVKALGLTNAQRGMRFYRCQKDGEVIGKIMPTPNDKGHRIINISTGSGHCAARGLAEFFDVVLPSKGSKRFEVTELDGEGFIFQAREPRHGDAMDGRQKAGAAGQLPDRRRKS